MFISTNLKRVFFFSTLITTLAIGSFAVGAESFQNSVREGVVTVFNEGTDELITLLGNSKLSDDERLWITRQHRLVKIRVEILLEKGICPADIELIRQDMRGLVDAVTSIRRQQRFAQSTHLEVQP